MKNILFLMTIFILSSCAVGPSFDGVDKPSNGNALIYVYRPLETGGSAFPSLYINYEDVASLPTGGYLKLEVPAGNHRMAFFNNGTGTIYTFESGESYFFKVTLSTRFKYGYDQYTHRLKKMNNKSAIREIEKTRLSKDLGLIVTSLN